MEPRRARRFAPARWVPRAGGSTVRGVRARPAPRRRHATAAAAVAGRCGRSRRGRPIPPCCRVPSRAEPPIRPFGAASLRCSTIRSVEEVSRSGSDPRRLPARARDAARSHGRDGDAVVIGETRRLHVVLGAACGAGAARAEPRWTCSTPARTRAPLRAGPECSLTASRKLANSAFGSRRARGEGRPSVARVLVEVAGAPILCRGRTGARRSGRARSPLGVPPAACGSARGKAGRGEAG